MERISAFLLKNKVEKRDPSVFIDISLAIPLESPDNEYGTNSVRLKEATRAFFSHESRQSKVDPHYLYNPNNSKERKFSKVFWFTRTKL